MSDDTDRLQRRLDRERKARAAAESIAERVTGQLYETVGQLQAVNDEVQAMNQSMRDFVAVASHDLRGPITAIIGFANLLDDSWEAIAEEKRREFVAVIARQTTRLSSLVDDLLTISAIEAGALDAHREPLRLDALLQVVTEGAPPDVRLGVPADVGDLTVLANHEHVTRIVTNYVTNAVKYGAPPIEITVEDTGMDVEIRVCDGGAGVPGDFEERLFTKFARAEDAATRAQPGTGLGLSIVRGLAAANGGDAWYERNEPTGSRFCVRLPKAPV